MLPSQLPCFSSSPKAPLRALDLLLLPNPLPDLVEPICHERGHAEEVDGRSEAAGGEVAFVLDWLVAARGRHVLRHDGGGVQGVQWVVEGVAVGGVAELEVAMRDSSGAGLPRAIRGGTSKFQTPHARFSTSLQ